jgi:membrane protein implicated in regulation of membrane protease activity
MSDIDWPLAGTLAVVFVVMSVLRWRYFRRRMERQKHRERGKGTPD